MFIWRTVAVSSVLLGGFGAANAMILFDQSPDTGTYGGSWVNQTDSQNFADRFELSQNAVVTDYDYFTTFDPSSFGTMHVKLLSDNSNSPGTYLDQEDLASTNYFVYGTYSGNTVYEVDLTLNNPWTITAGTQYWAGASGNGFEAAQMSLTTDGNPLADGLMAQFSGSSYSGMTSVGDQAFALEGHPSSTPEPASMAVLGLGIVGLIARRRRLN